MAKPVELPRWATDAGRVVEPSSGEKDVGWQEGFRPPARKMNWLHNITYQWAAYVEDSIVGMLTSNWTRRTAGKVVTLQNVAYGQDGSGNPRWVAVGNGDGVDSYILTSDDGGLSWTERAPTVPKNIQLNSVAWNGSVWVAVGVADGADAYILSSPDGVTWTERINSKNFTLHDVAWDPSIGLFAAVGVADGGDAYIVTSPDGVAWTEQSNPKNITLYGVGSDGNGLFVAVGDQDGADGDGYVLTSLDGTTWVKRPNPARGAGEELRDVTWAPALSLWVAVGDGTGTGPTVITSPDGATWTSQGLTIFGRAVVYDTVNNVFVILAAQNYSSVDGINWILRQFDTNLLGIGHDGVGRFVAVGAQDGSDSRIYTSLATG